MIKWGSRVLLIHLLEQGLSKSTIAEQLGFDRRTIQRWIAAGQLEREVGTGVLPRPQRRPSCAPKLAPFHSIIETRLGAFSELTAVRLFAEVQAAGYIIGLYMNPPENAAVFCVDEKTAIQALERTDPVLPLSPGRAERHGFEYVRHGTLSLYAALEVASGKVQGKAVHRHTSAEFIDFCDQSAQGSGDPLDRR